MASIFSRRSHGSDSQGETSPEHSSRDEQRTTQRPPFLPTSTVTSGSEDTLSRWKDELTQVTRIDGERAPRLTIGQAHPGGLAKLYAGQETALSLLVREPVSHRRALERARHIIDRSHELAARHGVGPIHLSIGQATWIRDGVEVKSAALLRPARVTMNEDDATITMLPGGDLDPQLTEAFAAQGITIDAATLVARATTAHGFSSSNYLAQLRDAGRALDGFDLRDDLVIGIFEHPATGLLRELNDPRILFSSEIVRALAGDEASAERTRQELPPANPQDRDPWKERGVGDLTPRQQDVIEAVAQGRSLLVDVPDGADDTSLVAAILADVGASGRTVIHIGGSPSRTARAFDRLEKLGVGEMVVRVDGVTPNATTLAEKLRYAMLDTSPVLDQQEVDDLRSRLREVRQTLSSYTTYLHRPFKQFGVSAFDALQVLTDLTSSRSGPSTRVRLRQDVLFDIARDRGEHARDLLRKADDLGIFSPKTRSDAWTGIVINSAEQVTDVLSRVVRLSQELLPQLRVRMGTVSGEAGITAATTLVGWEEQLAMFSGVRDVLDVFKPQIFERSAADMVIATASRQWRRDHGISMSRRDRNRLVKQAEDFVRPGVHVEDLHRELLLVQERRDVWQSHTNDDGWPTLPGRLDEVEHLTAEVRENLHRLEPMFSTAYPHLDQMNVSELAALFDRLAGDVDGAHELPLRVSVLKELSHIGLDPLVQDLRERHVQGDAIDAELDLAWWASILGLMLASEPKLGGVDPASLEEALAQGRELDAAQVATLAPQAISQLRRIRQQTLATRADQVGSLNSVIERGASDGELLANHPITARLVPVILTVPTVVPRIIREGHKVDVLVLDEIDPLPLAELVPLIARARQVVVLADVANARESGAVRRLADVLPTTTMDVAPSRLNDQVALLLARHRIDHLGVPVPWTAGEAPVNAVWVDGKGMPAPGASAVESTSVEIDAVVELVTRHAMEQPERSLGVVALNERHAERIRAALDRVRSKEPGLVSFFDAGIAEPFVVVGPHDAQGLSRDRVIMTLGFAKTPHGRVIHDFGVFSSDRGVAVMADVLRAVRGELVLVSSLRAGDIDRERLQVEGAQMLLDLLEIAEGQSGRGHDSWPILEAEPDRLLVDLADRLYRMGLEVVANIGIPGGMRIPLAIGHPEVPGRLLVAVLTDDDAYVAQPSQRLRDRMWPAMFEQQDWKVYTTLSMAVFIDPAKEANTIVQLVLDAVDEVNGRSDEVLLVPGDASDQIDAPLRADAAVVESNAVSQRDLDERVETTSQARQRDDQRTSEFAAINVVKTPLRAERPAIAQGLPLAAYSDDQLDEMAAWVRSDGLVRSDEETVEELRIALGLKRRGFQSDAVLGNVVRRTKPQAPHIGEEGVRAGSTTQDTSDSSPMSDSFSGKSDAKTSFAGDEDERR
ncbi:prevent-host-death family protein [Schaalia sp. ZJ1691]|uniref:prevent-host-death family protein n=1 Tax=Schaalia sp. ZJ1691 TaxID=2709404 RepID=UPI001980C637|nr:prevent-host-death family protein [Schaalia sp. ZJ1691]